MCGLTGIFSLPAPYNPEELRALIVKMTSPLQHRGPNDEGLWIDAAVGVAMGFRRLAIMDLSPQGHQPMLSDSGRYVLTFNGEIYNCEEVRSQLTVTGNSASYRGHSDTEVMLRAFEQWGIHEAAERFIGMFAFAVWDRRERRLHLGRDRLGEKPLYYGWQNNTFLFGSELKAITAFPGFSAPIDRQALAKFLSRGYIPAPHSIYAGIHKLTPGAIVTVTAADAGAMLQPKPYWSAKHAAEAAMADPFRGSDEQAVQSLDELLRNIVRNQMIADVPLGAFLSGGIDSSLVVAIMQALQRRPVRTFTIGFAEAEYDESVHARRVARHLGTDHVDLCVTPADALRVVPQLPAIYDEPFADSSQIPTYLVSKLAAQHVTVSLSGDGGDELFGGYPWYLHAHSLWSRIGWTPRLARSAMAATTESISVQAWDRMFSTLRPMVPQRLFRHASGDKMHKLADLLARADSSETVYQLLVSRWNDPLPMVGDSPHTAGPFYNENGGWAKPPHPILRYMYADTVSYLPDNGLVKVDRASMAASLESGALRFWITG